MNSGKYPQSEIEIDTYLKDGDDFYRFDCFAGKIKDPDYIDGAIELTIDGVKLITVEMWDNIDCLWAYIAQGLEALSKGKDFSTNFPDQPIKLKFTQIYDNRVLVSVKCIETKKVIVDKVDLMETLREHIKNFLADLIVRVPRNQDCYLSIINDLDNIVTSRYD